MAAVDMGVGLERTHLDKILRLNQVKLQRGALLSCLVHDVNNYLQALRSNTEAMASDLSTVEKDPKRLADESFRQHFVHCAGSILPATKQMMESNQLFLSFGTSKEERRCPVSECLGNVERILQSAARRMQVDLKVQVDKQISTVPLSDAELEQILFNLVLNAMQHVSHHQIIHGRVEVNATYQEKASHKVRVTVKDNGPGIHARDLARMFHFGFSTRPDGAGLGLYICRLLAESCGGRLLVADTTVFIGTTFVLELPN